MIGQSSYSVLPLSNNNLAKTTPKRLPFLPQGCAALRACSQVVHPCNVYTRVRIAKYTQRPHADVINACACLGMQSISPGSAQVITVEPL